MLTELASQVSETGVLKLNFCLDKYKTKMKYKYVCAERFLSFKEDICFFISEQRKVHKKFLKVKE